MKAINKEDLLLIIPMIQDRNSFNLDDFQLILERFGDDYFVEDGQFQKINESYEMKQIRTAYKNERGCKQG